MRSEAHKFIILITQDTENISVQQIACALRKKSGHYQVLIWDISRIRFSGNNLVHQDGFFQPTHMTASEFRDLGFDLPVVHSIKKN